MKIYYSILIAFIFVISSDLYFKDSAFLRKPASETKKKIIFLGVDGLDRRYFDYARDNLGLFQEFKTISTHVAPFPSISDYSWNKVVGATEIYGQKGRIKTYEAAYYDHSRNKIIDDTREYFRRIGQENHYYAGAFRIFFNPYIESFLYLPSKKLPLMELEQLKSSIVSDSNESFTSVLIASVDAISHTQAETEFLIRAFDQFVKDLIEEHKRLGIEAEVILVSDHGQDFDFKLGDSPKELKVADVVGAVNGAGYRVQRNLIGSKDIAMPIMALGNYVSLYFKNLSERNNLINHLKSYDWLEHTVHVVRRDQDSALVEIHDQKGYAELRINKNPWMRMEYTYSPKTSNSLLIPRSYHDRAIQDTTAKDELMDNVFPDSFNRIAEAVFEEEADFPDMIITLKGDYRVKGELDQFTKMFRTHGSLHKNSTNGIVASTEYRNLDENIRTSDILKQLNLKPADLFADNLDKGLASNFDNSIAQVMSGNIETGSQSYGSKRVFGLLNRVVNYSQYVLDVNSMSAFQELFQGDVASMSSPSNLSQFDFDFKKVEKVQVLSIEDIGALMDIVLENPDWKEIQKNPKFNEIKDRVTTELEKISGRSMKETGHAHGMDLQEGVDNASPYSHAAKTLVMKQYSLPFLFSKALNFPEFDKIKDTRSRILAKNQNSQSNYLKDLKMHIEQPSGANGFFHEVFKERKIVEDIYPSKLGTFYNLKDIEDITFVYVPGIYNSIFNNEIFSMGLDALRHNFGLRVIEAPVISACDSNVNGDILINFIQKDMAYRKERDRTKHRYMILGYSKGSVDTLYGFAKNPEFVKENIAGLMSIASPLQGSSILSKSDVPIMILELLGKEGIPTECRDENWASKTITPDQANRFFKDNGELLASLTRYYSISFASNIKDSHLWMQATKQIAGFGEINDGVVEVSASKFPEGFGALDLGIVEADHLAGIVASEFPQQAFMEALVITLQKAGAFNKEITRNWLDDAKYLSELTPADEHREKLKSMIKPYLDFKSTDRRDFGKVGERIYEKLKGTRYEVDEFEISKDRKGVITVEYHQDSDDFRFSNLFYLNFEDEISSEDDLVDLLLSKIQMSGKDLLISEKQAWRNYPVSGRDKIVLPETNYSYVTDFRINLRNMADMMKGKKIYPMLPEEYQDGINIIYDHQTPVMFREEYKFNYESSTSLAPDNNPTSGWISHLTSDGKVVAKMASNNSSIRLTSFNMRFMPKDFKKMKLAVKVVNNVKGANVLFGGSGKDDSPFQVWFTVRVNKPGTQREEFDANAESFIFGYYWGDKIPGRDLKDGEIYENYYSKKNFIIAVLPEAKQLLLAHEDKHLNEFYEFEQDIYADMKRAFPNRNIDQAEIIGITFQHDSNDTKDDSEAYFKYLKFK